MIKKLFVSLILGLMTITLASAAGPEIKEGKWEITTKLEMPGMPVKMPPNTFTQCIKKDQAVPQDSQPGQNCTTKDVVMKGDTVTWTMVCNNPGGQMTGKGRVTYHKDEMDGSMTMEGQGMQMTSHFKGKRIGPCQ